METSDKKIFTFLDTRQERIYKKLLEIGPGPAAFFKDACRMWHEEPPLEARTHFIAHALREIMGSIQDVMLPLDYKPSPEAEKKKQTHEEKIEVILTMYGIDPESEVAKLWKKIADEQEDIALYQFVHRNALGLPKTGNTFKNLWDGIQVLFDTLLNKIEGNYIKYFGTLDKFISKSNPSVLVQYDCCDNQLDILNYFDNKAKFVQRFRMPNSLCCPHCLSGVTSRARP